MAHLCHVFFLPCTAKARVLAKFDENAATGHQFLNARKRKNFTHEMTHFELENIFCENSGGSFAVAAVQI